MEKYLNRNGTSSVTHFKVNDDSITVWFQDGASYTYSNFKAGVVHVEEMKKLARHGSGLNTYIRRHVRKDYD